MSLHSEVINKFYSAFSKLDHAAMNSCYSDDIVFFDPVFGLLRGDQVRSMWEMLCKSAKDLHISWGNIQEPDDEYCTCDWIANYTFSKTGRHVENRIKAHMRFAEGKIIEHSDGFSLHKWSKQAFGLTGILFGWNSLFQNRIKNSARKRLLKFMENGN